MKLEENKQVCGLWNAHVNEVMQSPHLWCVHMCTRVHMYMSAQPNVTSRHADISSVLLVGNE